MFNTIVLLVVVLIIFNRLKNILGTRPENSLSKEEASRLFDLIINESKNQTDNSSATIEVEATPVEEQNPTERALSEIPNFSKEKFINNAKKAFEIITTSFSKGDTETLELLVNKTLIKKFQEIIESRRAEGITSETDLVGFEKAEIKEANVSKNKIAKIVIEFITEQVNILKNSKDEIIEGDENFIQTITDVWTFERSITSTNPTWLLVSTKK